MADPPETSDASAPLILRSKALHVFLLELALALRNTHEPHEVREILALLEKKALLFLNAEIVEHWRLSPDDVVDLHHLVRFLKRYLTDQNFALADPLHGPPH